MSIVQLDCPICNKQFDKPRNEYNRRKRLGRPMYCGRSCSGKANLKNIPLEKRHRPENLVCGNRLDGLSPFRWHLRNMKRRRGCTLTLQELKDQWDMQKGVCPYTGWNLKNMRSMNYADQLSRAPDRASLDRIDSSEDYKPGNIQFVAMIAQYAKNSWPEEELIRFCEAVVNNQIDL